MTTPLPLWHGIVLDQMLVGAAASLVNLIIHAVLLGVVVWTVRGLSARDTFVPGFLQYTIAIVLIGTLLMFGHFVEVMVWAVTYALAGVAPAASISSIPPSAIHDARLCRCGGAGAMAAAPADDGAERHHADRLVHGADHRDPAALGNGGREALTYFFFGRLRAARFFAACSWRSP
jgi:hypothetical protein